MSGLKSLEALYFGIKGPAIDVSWEHGSYTRQIIVNTYIHWNVILGEEQSLRRLIVHSFLKKGQLLSALQAAY